MNPFAWYVNKSHRRRSCEECRSNLKISCILPFRKSRRQWYRVGLLGIRADVLDRRDKHWGIK